jgi:ubiquinone/menaquinone biosynthesis C-methylase UbiE
MAKRERAEDTKCSVAQCDIFDFMANHVGLTVIHPGGFEATHRLLRSCHIDKSSRLLDIGCGKGTTSVLLAQKYGCNVVGLDLSEDLLRQATTLAKRKGLEHKVSFRVGDALNMPFADGEFDRAVGQAVLILLGDKKKAIQEALRVTKPGGYIGWLELSWKKQPTREFLDGVSNVICAYCMLGVETFENWKKLFNESGVKELQTFDYSQEFHGMRGMLADEGLANACKIMFKYLTNSSVRKRMKTIDKFFKEHDDYFGYGIYVGKK